VRKKLPPYKKSLKKKLTQKGGKYIYELLPEVRGDRGSDLKSEEKRQGKKIPFQEMKSQRKEKEATRGQPVMRES